MRVPQARGPATLVCSPIGSCAAGRMDSPGTIIIGPLRPPFWNALIWPSTRMEIEPIVGTPQTIQSIDIKCYLSIKYAFCFLPFQVSYDWLFFPWTENGQHGLFRYCCLDLKKKLLLVCQKRKRGLFTLKSVRQRRIMGLNYVMRVRYGIVQCCTGGRTTWCHLGGDRGRDIQPLPYYAQFYLTKIS